MTCCYEARAQHSCSRFLACTFDLLFAFQTRRSTLVDLFPFVCKVRERPVCALDIVTYCKGHVGCFFVVHLVPSCVLLVQHCV